MKVLFYKDKKDELLELSQPEILKRLYKMNRIFDPNDGRLQFQFHMEARDDRALLEAYPENEFGKRGKNGFSEFDYENSLPRLLLSLGKFDFLIENKDFEIKPDGKIIFQ
jgi:CRISPR-associated endonuclease Csn1